MERLFNLILLSDRKDTRDTKPAAMVGFVLREGIFGSAECWVGAMGRAIALIPV